MTMRSRYSVKFVVVLIAGLSIPTLGSTDSSTTFLEAGKRFLVQTEGRDDYNPKIVECETSSIGLCLRDTRGNPADNPLEPYEGDTLRVTFESWEITYVISDDGTGRTLDADGNELKPFKWSLE